MTLSAHDVAAVLRDRLPGLGKKKLHKLLYYCQGHHLAIFGEPLFGETISAWDMGPVVGTLWYDEKEGDAPGVRRELDEAALNTIGYVLSRYGALTGQDLENLTHSEEPWRMADSTRRPRESVRIELEWITQYFRANGATDSDEDEVQLDSAVVTEWLRGAQERCREDGKTDDPEEIMARIAELDAKLNPYRGVKRESGFPNLWFGQIPNSGDGRGNVVTCSYWIKESSHTVRCDNFGTLSTSI